ALSRDAPDAGRRQAGGRAPAYGPAAQARVWAPAWERAVGGGRFGTGAARPRVADAGAGVPPLVFYGQADVIVPVAAAVRVPRTPLAVGLAASYTRRRVTAKDALVETLDPAREHLYVLSASAVTVDAGVHAAGVLPGLDPAGAAS